MARSEEIAKAAVFLLSEDSSFRDFQGDQYGSFSASLDWQKMADCCPQ
jgi:hypothetical protein